jgi:hypothetical protein
VPRRTGGYCLDGRRISPSTVSRALAGSPLVAKKKRDELCGWLEKPGMSSIPLRATCA